MSHPFYLNLISLGGIFALAAIAWLVSEDRRFSALPWRVIFGGISLQLLLGFFVFYFSPTRAFLELLNTLLDNLFFAADAGARFIFGINIVPVLGQVSNVNLGYIFAFRALPAVIFFSGLIALLDNLGLIQPIVKLFANIFYKTVNLSGAETLSGSLNIFLGIEAIIAVKPFLAKMTRSELCTIFACSFATATSSTLAVYVTFLKPVFPEILGHLVAASILAIPACFVLAKIAVPETKDSQIVRERENQSQQKNCGEKPHQKTRKKTQQKLTPQEAAIAGALDGIKMAVSIVAVLILILGLVYLVDLTFISLASWRKLDNPLPASIGHLFNVVNLRNLVAFIFYPLTLLTGVPFDESWTASILLGRRLIETAIPSYRALADAYLAGDLSSRTLLIVSYGLAGVAHLASAGILIGGVCALIPQRRREVIELGGKALLIGTLATISVACVAGVFDFGNVNVLGIDSAMRNVDW
ncbi:MAG: nucleoside transporter C-terminal domain-containing protein [Oscillatoria sp. PMC 1068.18]|nr:nucleoside transporter C-terminal domain-containing protein [Oscillatoria sp. PMC 1076.18]MEC4990586.1 nucleoside transporter C-terminal domain-containing protein [Oscillatoria sp. PMC 1068.18]